MHAFDSAGSTHAAKPAHSAAESQRLHQPLLALLPYLERRKDLLVAQRVAIFGQLVRGTAPALLAVRQQEEDLCGKERPGVVLRA
jgi:hypothetical protein